MRAGRLRHCVMGLWLQGMDQIGELDGVLNEEHRDTVADNIEVPFLGIELGSETANIARRVSRAALARDGREPHEDGRALALRGQEGRARVLRKGVVTFEEAMGGRPARVDDPLGDALVVEVSDFLAEDEVLEQGGSTKPGLERVLIVGDRLGKVCRQNLPARIDPYAFKWLVAGIHTRTRGRAGFLRRIRLGERAGDDRRFGRLRSGSRLWRPRPRTALDPFGALAR